MKEFYNEKIARIFYDSGLDTLFLEYKNKVNDDAEFINVNTVVLKAFQTLQTHKFVADIRKMGVISVSAQKWVLENLLPGMIKHLKGKKLVHAQLLDPKEIFSKVSATNIKNNSKKVDEGFEVFQFSDELSMKNF